MIMTIINILVLLLYIAVTIFNLCYRPQEDHDWTSKFIEAEQDFIQELRELDKRYHENNEQVEKALRMAQIEKQSPTDDDIKEAVINTKLTTIIRWKIGRE